MESDCECLRFLLALILFFFFFALVVRVALGDRIGAAASVEVTSEVGALVSALQPKKSRVPTEAPIAVFKAQHGTNNEDKQYASVISPSLCQGQKPKGQFNICVLTSGAITGYFQPSSFLKAKHLVFIIVTQERCPILVFICCGIFNHSQC